MSEHNPNSLIELIKNLSVPEIIKNNAITALAKGIGKIITSASDVPTAYFEQQANLIRANGEAKVQIINAAAESAAKLFDSDSELANKALFHFGRKIIEQQINRDEVASKTVGELKKTEGPIESTGTIDDDWLTQFWNLAETKSKEDVQDILSKILSKEILSPGSTSPYTLQLLSVLTTDIGNAFNKLCNLSIDDGQSCYVIHPNVFPFQNIGPLNDYGISYEDLFDLDGVRLLRSAEALCSTPQFSDR